MQIYHPLSVIDEREDPKDTDPKAGGYDKPGSGKEDPKDTDPKAGGYDKPGR